MRSPSYSSPSRTGSSSTSSAASRPQTRTCAGSAFSGPYRVCLHSWSAFARAYNGAGYAQNQYDTKIAAAYRHYAH